MRFFRRNRTKLIVVICLILAVLIGRYTMQRLKTKSFKRTEMIMGTLVEITVLPPNEKAVKEAFNEMRRIDALMDIYRENSEASILNREGEARVSKETLEVIKKSIEFSRLTRGAFDITCGPLVNLWKEAKKNKEIPTAEEIKETISLVGYKKLILEGSWVRFKEKGMQIDLGGIAKGYAVDKAIEVLKKNGIKQALVNAGGDLYALGKASQGEKWQIGIQHPRQEGKILTIIKVKDEAVATSGDYQRYFMLKGKRFAHIVNPMTGWTVQDVPMSVTIIAPDAASADALATGVFVLGPQEGMKLINSLSGIEGMIVSEGMKTVTSSGWERFQN